MPGKRPINADVAAAPPTPTSGGRTSREDSGASEVDHTGAGPKSDARPTRRRRPVPTALKAAASFVLIAIVFLVAAILGGGGSNRETSSEPSTAGNSGAPAETEAAEALGHGSIATNNTSRAAGADPPSTAVAVALAVYPARTPAQRPVAVTLVDEGDWQGAVAAAVFMATPVRAPLLLSAGGELPDPTSQALQALAPRGGKGTAGAQAFVIGDAASPEGLKVARLHGAGPAAQAAAIASERDRLLGEAPQHLVLAPEGDPEFATPAAAWAARSGDPVLFAGATRLPAATAAALKRYARVPVYVLGPTSAISAGVVREVARIDPRVQRVAGETPAENAVALARYAGGSFGWNVNDPGHGFVIARSDNPLEAALAAPLSASGTWGPPLLTESADKLPKAVREYLLDVKPGYTTDPTRAFYNHVWIVGDEEEIDANEQAEINQLAELTKVGGEG